jgi:adenylate kinase family enzyme
MIGVAAHEVPYRARVVGVSGAGKSTFARALGRRLGVPALELDEVFWAAGWTLRDPDEGRQRLREFVAGPGCAGWVIDGNWNSRVFDLLDGADTIVWLDYSLRVAMGRVIRRTLGRGITRRELWHGNKERLTNIVRRDPEDNIIMWTWTAHPQYRAEYSELAARDARVLRFATPRAANAWLRNPRRP